MKLDDRQLELRQELGKREQEVEAREIAVRTREQHLDGREAAIASRSLALDDRESAVSIRELRLAQWEAMVLEREAELVTLEAGVVLCRAEFVQREEELAGRLEEVERGMEESVKELERVMEIERERERQRDEREKKTRGSSSPAAVQMLKWFWGAYVLPIVGKELTPEFLKPTEVQQQPTSQDTPRKVSPWMIRRDFFLRRHRGGGYRVLVSIGVCVVVLRVVLGRKAVGLGRR